MVVGEGENDLEMIETDEAWMDLKQDGVGAIAMVLNRGSGFPVRAREIRFKVVSTVATPGTVGVERDERERMGMACREASGYGAQDMDS